MADKNLSVVFSEAQKAVLEEGPVPKPGPGHVLVRSKVTLISTGTELSIFSGRAPKDSSWATYGKYPFKPGYDCVGEVVAVGEGVEKSLIGGTVSGYGSHERFTLMPVSTMESVPAGVPLEAAVFQTIAEIVMNGVRRGRAEWGESAVVFGLGLLGQFAVRLLSIAGLSPVVGVDMSKFRVDLLPEHPSIKGVCKKGAPVDEVKDLTNGRMADVVFEVTGHPDALAMQFKVLRRQGRLVILSSPLGPTKEFNFDDLVNVPSVTLIGTHNSSHPPQDVPDMPFSKRRHHELYYRYLLDGMLDVGPLVTRRCKPEDAPEVYRGLLENRSNLMGVLFLWD